MTFKLRLLLSSLPILLVSALVFPSGAAAQGQGSLNSDYTFSPGDHIRISVWPDSSLSGEFPIEESGVVHLPLLGPRQASGKTIEAFRAELRSAYAEDLQLPVVSVQALFRVSVLGAVRAPGVYWVDPSWGIFDLMSEASGFLEHAAEDRIVISRRNGESYRIDAALLQQPGSGEALIDLRAGDRLVVPENRGFNWGIFLQAATLVATIASLATR
jgi:polysaccharide export outer membrane protein